MKTPRIVITVGLLLLLGGAAWAERAAPEHPRFTSPGEQRPTLELPPLDPVLSEELPLDAITNFPADSNERGDLRLVRLYYSARARITDGNWTEAGRILTRGLQEYPDSRHLHQLNATLLWYWYKDREPLPSIISKAADEALRSYELALAFGDVDYQLTSLLADTLGLTGNERALKRVFDELVLLRPEEPIYLDYARGLQYLADPSAEEMFKKAIAVRAEGTDASVSAYAEWLLDQNRPVDVIQDLGHIEASSYLDFLLGVAHELLGESEAATLHYKAYSEHEPVLPAPRRFMIPGSKLQESNGVDFDAEADELPNEAWGQSSLRRITAPITATQARKGLAYLLYGEARGESVGGQRAEGWVVRNRVLRGTTYTSKDVSCPYVTNSGSSLADRYRAVMCQGSGSQFNGVCLAWCANADTTACSSNSTVTSVASGVYQGTAPDPVSGHCPGGIANWGGSYCNSSTQCVGYLDTYRLLGGVFNYGTNSACPSLCAASRGKVCGNGGYDNCFYVSSRFVRGGGVTYRYEFTSTGICGVTSGFSASSGTHRGHLEGPESGANFNLYLQKNCGSSSCWSTVASSSRLGSVEDINYTGSSATYRWRICASSGKGIFSLYTKRP